MVQRAYTFRNAPVKEVTQGLAKVTIREGEGLATRLGVGSVLNMHVSTINGAVGELGLPCISDSNPRWKLARPVAPR